MDTLDNDLLKALGELRHPRDRLHGEKPFHDAQQKPETPPGLQGTNALDTSLEELPEELMPVGRFNAKRLYDRLAATQ
jgi:hypothetical protein